MPYTPQFLDADFLAELVLEASGAEGEVAEQSWKDVSLAIVEWIETEGIIVLAPALAALLPPTPKDNFKSAVPPTPADDSTLGYSVGSRWIDTASKLIYTLVDATPGTALWKLSLTIP